MTKETLLRYCELLYNGMVTNARPNDNGTLVWEGAVTRYYHSLGISNAHYTRIMTTMQETGCIQILRRGARGITTLIALYTKPTAELIDRVFELQQDLTSDDESDMVQQQIRDLQRRLDGVGDLNTVLAGFEKRIRKLEGERSAT